MKNFAYVEMERITAVFCLNCGMQDAVNGQALILVRTTDEKMSAGLELHRKGVALRKGLCATPKILVTSEKATVRESHFVEPKSNA